MHKNNNSQDWFFKQKFPLKSYCGKTLGGGGQICPPGQLGLRPTQFSTVCIHNYHDFTLIKKNSFKKKLLKKNFF